MNMNSQVELIEHEKPQYLLLTPILCLPRSGPEYNVFATGQDIHRICNSFNRSSYLALDFETKGGDYSDDIEIIGMGLAWDSGSCYLNWSDLTEGEMNYLGSNVFRHKGLIAHNVYFDGGVVRKLWGEHARWHMCTYSLYSMLANEGYAGRYWGLKVAQTELLLWESSNEGDLDEWLVVNGYYIGNRRKDDSPEYLKAEYVSGGLRPNKGEMWRAPAEILGKYCILDAESTYLLYTEVLRPALQNYPGLEEFVIGHWMGLIRTLIDQKIHGILMDREGLKARKNELLASIQRLEHSFIHMPETMPHIIAMEAVMRDELRARAPERLKKEGGVSKNWEKWNAKLAQADAGQLDEYNFNINSGPQLRELLYDRIGLPCKVFTEKGEASTAFKALRSLGGIGSILTERMGLVKELSYIDKYLELTESRDTIHPSFRTPGTTTGRLSSKEPNLQQVPKTRAVMSLFKARPGTVWVDLDFSALEPVVATEYSKDRNMMQIYGDNMPANDIYIFVMAHIRGMGDKARALGYDPYNPSKEALGRVKKEMKRERSICKTVVLACQYGAGVKKVHQTLEEQEIHLAYEEVEEIHRGYWELFSQVKDFGRSLYFERKRNKGHILNAFGRPMAVPEEFEKDVLNRFIQSSGHDVLVRYISILTDLLDRERIDWKPIVIDFHDATTVEVPEQEGQRVLELFNQAMDILNSELNGTIKLRGVPVIGTNLAEVKEPEE